MNKDLRKVVILLAHPNIKGSQANKALIDAVSDIEGVAVFNLYELSEDIAFNVDEWSKIISDASAVIYQFPFYWMSAPSLLKKWQDEVDAIQQEAQNMYKTYQSDLVFLSAEMKSKREEAIVQKEQEAQDLKRKYFGPEGELFKKRESLMKPIQDEIYNAVKEISEDKGYQMVMDRASSMNIIFASPKIDISNEVLIKLGYSK